jgi:fumarate reductase subunit C
VTLLLVVYHAWTWFKVMPKTLPRVPLSDNGIVTAGMGAVALVTLVLLWIA